MSFAYEITSVNGFPKQCWLFDSQEQRLWRDLCKKWKKENPSAGVEKEIVAETLIRLHIMEHRLVDRRRFWNGSDATSYRVEDGRKTASIDTEDAERQTKEFDRYYWQILAMKERYLKLALANSIEIAIDNNDISALFAAMDAQDKQRMQSFRGNGR